MLAALTGMGLSAAAGLNAYIPFLVVALIARFTDYITLPVGYEWIESTWAIGIGAALLLAEVILDKIPAVDTINDTIQTFIRPSMGGLIFAATTAAAQLDNSTWMKENPWVSVVLGVLISGLVHTGKMAARPGHQRGHGGHRGPGGLDGRGHLVARPVPHRAHRAAARHPRPGAARLAADLDVAAGAPMAAHPTRPRLHLDLTPVSSRRPRSGGGSVNVVARPQSVKVRSEGVALRPDEAQQGAAAVGGHPQPRAALPGRAGRPAGRRPRSRWPRPVSDSSTARSGWAKASVRIVRSVNDPSSVASDSVTAAYLPTSALAAFGSPVISAQCASSPPTQ